MKRAVVYALPAVFGLIVANAIMAAFAWYWTL